MTPTVKGILSVLLVGSFTLSAGSGKETTDSTADKASIEGETRRAAPDFRLPDLNGRWIKSKDLNQNIVVLDFWATWCGPCIVEIPVFNSLQEKFAARGVKVLGLAVQSGWPRDIKQFVAKHKMEYTILAGNDDVVSDFEVIGFPTTFLIGRGWRVYKKYSGAYEGKASEIERDIEALLKEKRTTLSKGA